MKETVKTVVITTLILLVVLLSVKSMKCYQKTQDKPEPVIITDTLTQVVYDTVFIDHFETVKLPVVDTTICYITDTVTRVDSVEVEVPISIYKLDTIFSTDTTSLNIRIQNSGYAVKLDTLSYSFTYRPTKTKKTHWFIGPSLGIGYDFTSGKLVPTIGIGIIIKRF